MLQQMPMAELNVKWEHVRPKVREDARFAFGELDVGHAPILLQMSEDLTIDPIERHCVSHS